MKQDRDPDVVTIVASMKQSKQVKGSPLEKNGVVMRGISENAPDSIHNPFGEELDGVLIPQGQDRAELQNVDHGRIVHGGGLSRFLAVRRGRRWIFRLDGYDRRGAIVIGQGLQQRVDQSLKALSWEVSGAR